MLGSYTIWPSANETIRLIPMSNKCRVTKKVTMLTRLPKDIDAEFWPVVSLSHTCPTVSDAHSNMAIIVFFNTRIPCFRTRFVLDASSKVRYRFLFAELKRPYNGWGDYLTFPVGCPLWLDLEIVASGRAYEAFSVGEIIFTTFRCPLWSRQCLHECEWPMFYTWLTDICSRISNDPWVG